MDPLITMASSRDEQDRAARVAVLPVGSFEQHGDFLPLITDTVVACLIAPSGQRRIRPVPAPAGHAVVFP